MIIGYPPAYLDEAHYSVNARFQADWGYTAGALSRHLYGGVTSASIDFPCRLDDLAARLPEEHGYTADILIYERTLYPFYAAFLTPERRATLTEAMRGARGVSPFTLGYQGNTIKPSPYLRYCPVCVVEERGTTGECYWHRVHQVPGVLVCPIHGVPLRDSIRCGRDARAHYDYVTAEDAIGEHVEPPDGSADPHADILRAIAMDAQWLLEQRDLSLDWDVFRARYLGALRERDLATHRGTIRQGKLVKAFEEFYPRALLDRLQCAAYVGDKPQSGWLPRIFRMDGWASSHPLRHLLAMRLLGYTAETFFSYTPTAYGPFGDGPYPCLNPASDHYREPVIDTYALRYHYGEKALIGTFACRCGFVYRRRGPEQSPEEMFTYGSVAEFGAVWHERLSILWQDGSLTVKDIGKRLGVSAHAVHGQSIRLGLPRLRPGYAHPLSRPTHELAPIDAAQRATHALAERKAEWVRERDAHPGITGEELRKRLASTYQSIQQCDPVWLKSETPPTPRTYVPSSPTAKDWTDTDRAAAGAVRAAARRLLTAPDYPRQAFRKRIAIEAGYFATIAAQMDNLPLTKAALDEVGESREDYIKRKIVWASTRYREEGDCPSISRFRHRINVQAIDDNEQFREDIEETVRGLEVAFPSREPSSPPLW